MKHSYQESVIASIIQTPSLLAESDLLPDEFSETNSLIYQSILDLESSSTPIDIISVCDNLLKSTGKNYLPMLGGMVKDGVLTNDHTVFKHYANSVRNEYCVLKSKFVAERLLSSVDQNGMESVDEAIKELMQLSAERKNHECHISEAVKSAMEEADRAENGKIG